MKTILKTILVLIPFWSFSQVTIGKNGAAPSSPAVLLEFGNDGDKGIIVPYINGEPADASVGTVILDTHVKRMKVKTAAGWVDLSGMDGTVSTDLQDPLLSAPSAKVIIGANTSDAPGILVLESTDKALVLPKVTNYTDIVNPSAGMLVYVTTNKRIAVFNGSKWTFWKP